MSLERPLGLEKGRVDKPLERQLPEHLKEEGFETSETVDLQLDLMSRDAEMLEKHLKKLKEGARQNMDLKSIGMEIVGMSIKSLSDKFDQLNQMYEATKEQEK